MEFLLDKKGRTMDVSGASNLEDVLMKIATEHISPDQVIKRVRLNGEIYSEDIPHDAAGINLDDINSLEVDTVRGDEIAWDFLENGAGQVNSIMEGAVKVSELFRVADETDANEHYAEFLEGMRLFLSMVDQVSDLLKIDFSSVQFNDGSVQDRIEKLSGKLNRMLDVQAEEDWIMVADLLEYEIAPLLGEWKDILPLLKEKISN